MTARRTRWSTCPTRGCGWIRGTSITVRPAESVRTRCRASAGHVAGRTTEGGSQNEDGGLRLWEGASEHPLPSPDVLHVLANWLAEVPPELRPPAPRRTTTPAERFWSR